MTRRLSTAQRELLGRVCATGDAGLELPAGHASRSLDVLRRRGLVVVREDGRARATELGRLRDPEHVYDYVCELCGNDHPTAAAASECAERCLERRKRPPPATKAPPQRRCIGCGRTYPTTGEAKTCFASHW